MNETEQPIQHPTPASAVSGFCVLDGELGIGEGVPQHWTVISVTYGHQTDWRLLIEVETEGEPVTVVFVDPASFRAQDEREMLCYWTARSQEATAVAHIYRIDHSPYLKEFENGSVSGASGGLHHYLITGSDSCVDVLSKEMPTVKR